MKSFKNILTSGFGSKVENEGSRLVNKDGSFNFIKNGVPFMQRFSLYHALITMSLWKFIGSLIAFYIVINSFFATIYVALGVEHLGLIPESTGMQFLNAFFFSSQTLTTVGYGAIAPTGVGPNIVASLESFVGLLTFAMATGLLYGRFSKPRARIMYSKHALVSPYQQSKGLMFRLANATNSQMINVSTKVILALIEEKDGKQKRNFYNLKLEFDQISSLPASWTIVHPIDEDSPIINFTLDDLVNKNAELLIAIEGYDETYSQQVHSRTSYKIHEIVFDAKFIPIIGRNNSGQATVNLDQISHYENT